MAARTATRRVGTTGARLPFTITGASCSPVTASPTSAAVVGPSRISPGEARCSRRAARLTGSPVTSVCRPPPVMTSPVLMPIRSFRDRPRRATSSRSRAPTSSRISTAARTARSASSSWALGIPKTAITASPMNFSTVPPWKVITRSARRKAVSISSRSGSGSRCSPSSVDPTTSAKSTVTSLRAAVPVVRKGVPQPRQNLARGGLRSPQSSQTSSTATNPMLPYPRDGSGEPGFTWPGDPVDLWRPALDRRRGALALPRRRQRGSHGRSAPGSGSRSSRRCRPRIFRRCTHGSVSGWTSRNVQSGNVRHLLPPGAASEPAHVDAKFTLPADRADGFYADLAGWWREIERASGE